MKAVAGPDEMPTQVFLASSAQRNTPPVAMEP